MGAARNADGRLEVFARGNNNQLWHIWELAPAPVDGGWSRWESLGGDIRGGPSVVWNAADGLVVFVRDVGGAILQRWQQAGGWSEWTSLGGGLTASPVAAVNHDRGLEVFARGLDGALWHNWQRPHTDKWEGWASLGGSIVGTPAVSTNNDGRMELFVQGTDGTLLHCWQAAGGVSTSWTPLVRLAGPVRAEPCVVISHDARMEVFYPSIDGLRHTWQVAVNNGWTTQPDNLLGIVDDRPCVCRDRDDGRLEVFHIGRDRGIYVSWQARPDQAWQGWQRQGLSNLVGKPCIAMNADGRLEVFAIDDTRSVVHMWQRDRPGSGSWVTGSLGGPVLGGLAGGLAELGRCSLWEGFF